MSWGVVPSASRVLLVVSYYKLRSSSGSEKNKKKGRGPEFVETLKPYCLLSSFYAEDMLKLQKSVPQVEPPRPDTQFHDDSIVHEKLSHSWIPAMAYYQLVTRCDVQFFWWHWGSLHPKAPAPKFTAFCMKMPNAGSKLDERLVLLTSVAAFEWKPYNWVLRPPSLL